jgi:enamine deaminase RidA (YjgF/YER057c/UK114 family)
VPAVRTYSHGVIIEAGRTLFVAEQTSRDKDENIVYKGDAAGQTRQVLENIGNVIEEVGGWRSDGAKTTVYFTDPANRVAVGNVRKEYFERGPSANTLLLISQLAVPDFLHRD